MPKHVADGGIAAGIILITVDVLMPQMKPNLLAGALLLIGCLFIGGAIEVWRSQTVPFAVKGPSSSGNKMGTVRDNDGIVTQGQKGDNSISK